MATEYPRNQTVHALFERQVESAPESIAIEYEGEALSYAELNRRANQVAGYLQERGVGPEVIVGICMERSLEMLVALIGIVKSGGAYLPLDPQYPQSRLGFMLKDTQAQIILTMAELRTTIPPFAGETICLDTDWPLIAQQDTQNPTSGSSATSLIYVIYTSGSTGRPKGTMIEHRGVVRLVRETNYVDLNAEQVFLQFAPISFDASTFEIWGCLLNGAKLVVCPAGRSALDELGSLIQERHVSILWLTSALFNQMVDNHLASLSGVTQLLAGGEALSPPQVRKFLASLDDRRLINGYGPTENTTFTCCHVMVADSRFEGSVPIGRPVSNTTVYILDESMRPVAEGVAGELYIGGDGLARGYLNQAELTAEKFVVDPFNSEPGARLYRTGDQVRYLAEGNIEFIGRIDHQVKLRGYRIELGEIESVLGSHSAVRNSVVMLREDKPGDRRLTGYLVPNPHWIEEASRAHIGSHVAEWQAIYAQAYETVTQNLDPTFDISGWASSYSGEPISEKEMREWVDATVARIQTLQPKRVLEIGCGTGLLLSRLASNCERYVGVDFSAEALNKVKRLIQSDSSLAHVELIQAAANNLPELEDGDFDTVIINSVVQYFPNMDYLLGVLRFAVQFLQPGGAIFVGDLRNYSLLKAFHSLVQLFQASDKSNVEALLDRIQRHLKQEHELTIAPGFFDALPALIPEITAVEVQLKRGRFRNELNQFRYDVTLRTHGGQAQIEDADCYDWRQQNLTLEKLRNLLQHSEASILAVRGIPNGRLEPGIGIMELVKSVDPKTTAGELRAQLESRKNPGMDPELIWDLQEETSYRVHISWSRASQTGDYDAIFSRESQSITRSGLYSIDTTASSGSKSVDEFANNPLTRLCANDLIKELRRYLQDQLPEYMIPSVFYILDSLPLTPNGKIDRRALPTPNEERPELESDHVAPRSPLENTLVEIWEEVLGVSGIGIHDNFFHLGGDSILGAVFANRLQDLLSEQVHVVAVFDAPTVAELSVYLKGNYAAAVARFCGRGTAIDPVPDGVRIDAPKLEEFRTLLARLSPRDIRAEESTKNSPAVFILTAPRSGSTLLRVMLGGHSRLFAPPELELLSYDSLRERREVCSGRFSYMAEGSIRAIMEIKKCSADKATAIMQDCEDQNMSSKDFYALMQSWLGDRLLVDKTATYAQDIEVLKRAEQDFDEPLYLHLVRHPFGMIPSFEEARLDRIVGYQHNYSSRELAELTWLLDNRNINEFLETVPESRCHRIRFEDMVGDPQSTIDDICKFLSIEVQPEMMRPYVNQDQRMTDGIHPLSKGLVDIKFHGHKGIDASVGERWKDSYASDFLGEVTWQLADSYGYQKPSKINETNVEQGDASSAAGGSQEDRLPTSASRAAELLARIDQLSEQEMDELLAQMPSIDPEPR